MPDDDPTRAILDVGAALVSSLEFEEALANVAEKIGSAMDVCSVEIWRGSPNRQTAVCEAAWGRPGEGCERSDFAGTVVDLARHPDLRHLIAGATTVERHIDDPDLPADERETMKDRGYKSTLAAPLTVGDEVIGVLTLVETRDVRRFSEPERERFARLCQLAATGIRNAELFRRQEERNRRLMGLLESSRAMASSLDPRRTIESVKATIGDLLAGFDCRVDVHLRREDGSFVRVLSPGDDDGPAEVVEAWSPDGLCLRALDERQPLQARVNGERARLVVPLVLKNDASGCIEMSGRLPRPFTQDEVEFLQILANQTAVAVENARLYRAVARQALNDSLTGLYTRRFFFDRLYSEAARAERYRETLSLLMADVDDFGQFNAVRGRESGDEVLRGIGRLFKSSLRNRIDVPCRFGGQKFALLLPKTPVALAGAVGVAERLRKRVEETEFRNEDHVVLGRFTVSLGVAGIPDHADDADELVAAAEESLRAAKAAGKNRTRVYGMKT